jgi:hypothetical protein
MDFVAVLNRPKKKRNFFSNKGVCGGFKTAGNFRRKIWNLKSHRKLYGGQKPPNLLFFCGGLKPPITLGGKFEIQKTAGNFAADKHRR